MHIESDFYQLERGHTFLFFTTRIQTVMPQQAHPIVASRSSFHTDDVFIILFPFNQFRAQFYLPVLKEG